MLPNISVGYNIFKQTSIYANYFVLKDVFATHQRLTLPTTQSLSWGIKRDFALGTRTTATLDFQARELWSASHVRFGDFLPSINLTRQFSPRLVGFASALLQMRSNHYFQGPTRELDPFYTVGLMYRYGLWNFTATDTYVTNWRSPPFHHSGPGNESMIADFEISHPVPKVPAMSAFVRGEPVWNWDSHYTKGQNGFGFRLFGGLRIAFAKQPYGDSIERLRQQLRDSEKQTAPKKPDGTAPNSSRAPMPANPQTNRVAQSPARSN